MVLYDQLFSPRKIVAIDHSPEPVKPLETYISRRHKRDVVKPFYGVNQADRTVMEAILAREFPGRDLNLIVDDASHFYAETRDAFNISFPYLAPGGHYVIEDWAWAHWAGDTWQREQVAALAGKPALSNMIVEILMLAASRPDFIKDIVIDHNMAIICKGVRGPAPGNFDIGEHYLLRGKNFGAWL